MYFSAANLICIAPADLVPGLHKRGAPLETIRQELLMLPGIGTITLLHVGHGG